MSERIDCAVIGAGVIGLAVARALALAGREVIVLEAEGSFGTGTSSRNSEVIHSGIYYPAGSLKARLCVAGRRDLYRFCASHGVEHRPIGKLIVATSPEEVPTLSKYQALARANGVDDLEWLNAHDVQRLEPEVRALAGLYSPSTGILDSHALMLAYVAELEAHGGTVAYNSPVTAGRAGAEAVELEVGAAAPMRLRALAVVNCAGLEAQGVSRRIDGIASQAIPARYLAKGHYFSLSGRAPFHHLVYPVANAAGLGTHVTLDLAGGARFGPDVQWIEQVDYGFDASRKPLFVEAIKLYYPALDESRLLPGYTGIRPKLTAAGQPAADFCIRGPQQHGGCPYVALYGIESPGLTASLALAECVAGLLGGSSADH